VSDIRAEASRIKAGSSSVVKKEFPEAVVIACYFYAECEGAGMAPLDARQTDVLTEPAC